MANHILLTGGSGSIGRHLTQLLLNNGYTVSHLSRAPENIPGVKSYLWNVDKGEIDAACITGVDTIVHLAGAGVAEKRWTKKRKQEIIESRTKSIQLIYDLLKEKNNVVKSVVSASATGFYGDRDGQLLTENTVPGEDFLAETCIKWEAAVDEGAELGLRIVKLRTGIVLDEDGGALPQMANPVKWGVGSPLGSGRQWMPWIHWQDVVDLYFYAITNAKLKGVYNMVAPNPVTNKDFTKILARQLHRPLWAPNVPAFLLKLLFGEMSIVILGSTKVTCQKIEEAGFKFKYTELAAALKEIYG
jgi:uncharacterized protein (TIGR01777 family)